MQISRVPPGKMSYTTGTSKVFEHEELCSYFLYVDGWLGGCVCTTLDGWLGGCVDGCVPRLFWSAGGAAYHYENPYDFFCTLKHIGGWVGGWVVNTFCLRSPLVLQCTATVVVP